MRVVLSRKGFDSTAGGGPSPLLPDGRLVTLPIPERRPGPRSPSYDDLGLAALMRSLGYPSDGRAHLDPDLIEAVRPRAKEWRGAFGQVGAAASHLISRGVGSGDLFLFFGLFRRVEHVDGGYRFVPGAVPFHAIWGYLEVERRVAATEPVAWAGDHAHFADPDRGRPNIVFLARAGRFGAFRFGDELRLTRPEARLVTDWQLPACFDAVDLTYHRSRSRDGSLRAASRGQEFVCEATSAVAAWAQRLIGETERWA